MVPLGYALVNKWSLSIFTKTQHKEQREIGRNVYRNQLWDRILENITGLFHKHPKLNVSTDQLTSKYFSEKKRSNSGSNMNTLTQSSFLLIFIFIFIFKQPWRKSNQLCQQTTPGWKAKKKKLWISHWTIGNNKRRHRSKDSGYRKGVSSRKFKCKCTDPLTKNAARIRPDTCVE